MTSNTSAPSGVGKAATSGFLWLVVQSLASRGVGFISQLVLARLLLPEDFGAIGLALTVTTIANSLIGFGIDDVLLQRQKTMTRWEPLAFWMCLGVSVIGMFAMFVLAPFAAHWYHSPSLVGLIVAIALSTPLRALGTVSAVKIRAQMDFRFLAACNTFEIVALQVLTIILAAMGTGAYAFAIPYSVVAVLRTAWLWKRAAPFTKGRYRKVQARYLLGNSTLILLSRTCIEFINQGDYIVLGLIASKMTVGYYFFAFRFAAQPVRMLAGNVSNVVFPALTHFRNEPARQIDAVVRACRLLGYLVMPFCFLQAGLAKPGLHLLFGERWMPAVPYVVILSIGLPFDAISWITGSLLSARREFTRSCRYQFIALPLFYIMVGIGAYLDDVMGVALAVAVYYFIWPPAMSYMVMIGAGVPFATVAEFYFLPLLFACISVGAGMFLAQTSLFHGNDFMECMVIGVVTCVLYPALLAVFRPEMFREIVNRFGGKLRKR
ncbi:lipopolysaccharide biosynthesis protein [Acetobacter conturbans]|uniref:Oligosaccharide flippase family protein n=1 Tax=Acetobacter conturbans TaxID=1737472 RepID=A0ABX0JVH0_9PROT|nr:lipopolysaccharide biosynthesis protein [Acetobacter conturbans]NHN87269.1 oligosaccharide flippase family protein [Acetobacter conturbans]